MIVRYYIESVNIWWLGRLGGLKVCYGWKKGIFLGNSYLNREARVWIEGGGQFWCGLVGYGHLLGGSDRRAHFICVCTALSVAGWVSREISVFSVQLVRGLLGVIGL